MGPDAEVTLCIPPGFPSYSGGPKEPPTSPMILRARNSEGRELLAALMPCASEDDARAWPYPSVEASSAAVVPPLPPPPPPRIPTSIGS